MSHHADLTRLLETLDGGDPEAIAHLLPLVYPELRAMAQRHLRGERADHTLDTSALVHEAYLKLVGQPDRGWLNRAHFFAVAATAMRRILVTYARARMADKRGGGAQRVTFVEGEHARETRADELVALDEALDRLGVASERAARVVELSFFGGLTQAEIADALGVSEPTVRRDWRVARAYLSAALREPASAAVREPSLPAAD